MTREEFINDINDIDDLYCFLSDNELYDYYDNIYNEERLDEWLNDTFAEDLRYNNWREVYSRMADVPEGYDWYHVDGYGDIYGIDDGFFDSLKQEVLEYCDDNEMWDDEAEELDDYEDEEEIEEEEEYQIEDESVMFEMFASAQAFNVSSKEGEEGTFEDGDFDDPELTEWGNNLSSIGIHPMGAIGSVTIGDTILSHVTGTIERSC